MNRRGEGAAVKVSENTKTFVNVILHHVPGYSGFSRPNLGMYANVKSTHVTKKSLLPKQGARPLPAQSILLGRFCDSTVCEEMKCLPDRNRPSHLSAWFLFGDNIDQSVHLWEVLSLW